MLAPEKLFGDVEALVSLPEVVLLGTRQVRDLTLGLSATRAFDGIPNSLVSMNSFRHHSVLAAVGARLVAQECPRARPETSFGAGLLHDVGPLVRFARWNSRSPGARRSAKRLFQLLDLH
ncbi:MAG: HDOD domain-containing protein [Steroidobacteraceae bacterium]|jgi:HD-like signal output (HDOD) protein|nr:HDOD domain-containing protein [Steroidobacteraceae bacterium]